MKYTNKKTNIFTAVLFSFLICAFSACGNMNTDDVKNTNQTTDKAQVLITGNISSLGRSAVTSYTFTDSHKMEITASRSVAGMAAGDPVTGTITNNSSYSIVLNAAGEWSLYLNVYLKEENADKYTLVNVLNKKLNVSEEGKILDEGGLQLDASNINFVISPDYTSINPGSINLTIKDESGKLKYVSYSAELNGTTNENSLSEIAKVIFENNEAVISRNGILPNSYKVSFDFTDAAGNVLYSCCEIINVVPGFATDTWVGDGAHLSKENGKTEFVITNDLIEKFGTDVVPTTQMAFYNYSYMPADNKDYKYYFADEVLTALPGSFDLGVRMEYGSNQKPNFCYDNDGKIYVFSCFYANEKNDSIVTTDQEIPISILSANEEINSIAFDRKKDKLYMLGHLNDDIYLYSCDKTALDNIENSAKKYNISDINLSSSIKSQLKNCKTFAVYNDVLYIPYKINVLEGRIGGTVNVYLNTVKVDLSNAEYDADSNSYILYLWQSNLEDYKLSDGFATGAPAIVDSIYQDDNIYLLIRDVSINDSWNDDSNPFCSRGAVIRINLFTNTIAELGWTDEKLDVSSAGAYLKTNSNWDSFCYLDEGQQNLFVMDGTQKYNIYQESLISSKYPSFYAPVFETDLVSDAFYGPQRFIALKPKKLVISDDGFAFYTNDDGALTYRNVNRVVIVDLEAFAIESCTEVPVKYAGNVSSMYTGGDYKRVLTRQLNDISDNFYYSKQNDVTIYDKSGTEITAFSTDSYIAIKCADSSD